MASSHDHRPTLVLIHAFPLHSGMWREQQRALADIADVVTPDLPGFHHAPGLDEESFTLERIARHLRHELEAKGIDRCIIGGLSMGGYIAFEFFRQFPEKVCGLLLADTKAAADTDEARKGRYASVEKIGHGDFDAFAEGMMEKLLAEKTRRENPELVEQVRRMMYDSPPESAVAALLGMSIRRDSTELLPTINVPTALIFGEHDAVTTVDEGKMMAEAIPDARLHIVKNAGHLSNLENPAEFNAAVTELLERVDASVMT